MLLRSRQLSLQLQMALEQERTLKEQKLRFVSVVSHEFRSPLNTIFGFSRLLEKPDLANERRADFLHRIQAAIKRMVVMLDDVLILSKTEAGRFASNSAPLALSLIHI